MRLFLILLLAALSGFVSGCEKGNLVLDNAGEVSLKVSIDGKPHSLKAGDTKYVKIKPGIHRFSIKDAGEQTLEDGDFTLSKRGLLNLGKSTYVVWRDLYGAHALRDQILDEDWLEIEGKEFFGDLEVLDGKGLYFEAFWDYGLDEPFPKKKYTLDRPAKEEYYVMGKLFRFPDFVKAYSTSTE
jgi:hypothetical protein